MPEEGHYAEMRAIEGEFRAEYKGVELAKAGTVQELQEHHPSYEFRPVFYFPKSSIDWEKFSSNDHHTHCPIKGEASYWSASVGGEQVENLLWGYPEPLDSVPELKGHFAFDPSKGAKLFRDGEAITNWGIRKKS